MADNRSNIPSPNVPFVENQNKITQFWYQFMIVLYNRTGGALGVPRLPDDTFSQIEAVIPSQTGETGQLRDDITAMQSEIASLSSMVDSLREELAIIQAIAIFHTEATQFQEGLMSAADKIKLDGL